jgi:hypothetical protein
MYLIDKTKGRRHYGICFIELCNLLILSFQLTRRGCEALSRHRVAGLRHANEDNCRNGIGCIWCHEGFCGETGIGPGLPMNRIDPW